MIASIPPSFRYALLGVLIAAASGVPADGTRVDQPFEAHYRVLMDGKPRMQTVISLTVTDAAVQLASEAQGVKGLARMLGLASHETASGAWQEGVFRPLEYRHHARVAGRDDRWSARFDADGVSIHTEHEDGQSSLSSDMPTWDPLSLSLELRRRMAGGETSFEVQVVDEDEIDVHRYEVRGQSLIDTGLGCYEVTELERVRENSSRYSRGWYAPALGYLPLRIQHGKHGGKDFDLRIERLDFDDRPIQPRDRCPG